MGQAWGGVEAHGGGGGVMRCWRVNGGPALQHWTRQALVDREWGASTLPTAAPVPKPPFCLVSGRDRQLCGGVTDNCVGV